MAIVASDYQNKVNSYFQATYGRQATASELATWTNNLLDNQGSVWTGNFQQTLSSDKGWGAGPLSEADAQTQVDGILSNLFGSEASGLDASIAEYYVDHLVAGTIKPRGVVNAMLNDLGLMPRVNGELGKPAGWGYGPGVELTSAQVDAYKEDTGFSVEGDSFTLTTAVDEISGTSENDTISGVSSGLASTATLNSGDQIDGGAGTDTLDLELSSSFNGFSGSGKMENVEVLDITNTSALSRIFDASGVTGLDTVKIDANDQGFKVQDLASADVAVEVTNADGDNVIEIAYATSVTSGTSDTLAMTLNDVGTVAAGSTSQKTLDIKSAGIETLDIISNGTANYATAANVTAATTINISGGADLKLDAVAATVTSVAGANATGDLTLDLTAATLASVSTGSGDDTVTVTDFDATATLQGGDGTDKLILSGTAAGNYKPGISGFETLETSGALGGAVVLAADNITDITTINIKDDMGADLTVANSSASSVALNLIDTDASADVSADTITHTAAADFDVTVSSEKTTAGIAQTDDLSFANATAVTLDVENYSDYQGNITAAKAQTFTANVAKGGSYTTGTTTVAKAQSVTLDVAKGGTASAEIIADTADTVSITTNDAQTVKIDAKAATSMVLSADGGLLTFAANTAGNNFEALQSLTVSGTGGITSPVKIGKDAASVTVDASDSTGPITLTVEDYSGTTGGAATVVGSDIGANAITIEDDRNEIDVTGGINNDTVTYKTDYTAANTEGTITIDLGTTSTGDTLVLFNGNNDLTSATVSLTGVDVLDAGGAGNDLTILSSVLTGQSIDLGTGTAFGDVMAVGTDSAETIDFSGIDSTAITKVVFVGSKGEDTITASEGGTDVFSYTAENQLGDTIKNFNTAGTDLVSLDVGGTAATTGGSIFAAAMKSAAATTGLQVFTNSTFLTAATGIVTAGASALTAKHLMGTYASSAAFLAAINAIQIVATASAKAATVVAAGNYVAFGLGSSGTIWAANVASADMVQTTTGGSTKVDVGTLTANDVTTVGTVSGVGITDIVLA
jgi:hypothetical protein